MPKNKIISELDYDYDERVTYYVTVAPQDVLSFFVFSKLVGQIWEPDTYQQALKNIYHSLDMAAKFNKLSAGDYNVLIDSLESIPHAVSVRYGWRDDFVYDSFHFMIVFERFEHYFDRQPTIEGE